jgi:hypothetical protein
LQLFKKDAGSAVVEFVMLGTPALLIFASGVSFFVNGYIDTVVRAIAVDASRFAALADQDLAGANQHLDAKIRQLLPKLILTKNIQLGKTAVVQLQFEAPATLFNIANRKNSVRVETPIESY